MHLENDKFKTELDSVIAFGLMYNPRSISEDVEYGSNIYLKKGIFTFRQARTDGKGAGVSYAAVKRSYRKRIATAHTHAAYSYGAYDDVNFSGYPGGKQNADKRKANNYVITPGGYLLKYNVKTKKETVITNCMPRDANHPRTDYATEWYKP